MHVVVPLTDERDDQEVVRKLQDNGTVARPLSIYYASKPRRSGVILGFAGYTTDEIHGARLHALQ